MPSERDRERQRESERERERERERGRAATELHRRRVRARRANAPVGQIDSIVNLRAAHLRLSLFFLPFSPFPSIYLVRGVRALSLMVCRYSRARTVLLFFGPVFFACVCVWGSNESRFAIMERLIRDGFRSGGFGK